MFILHGDTHSSRTQIKFSPQLCKLSHHQPTLADPSDSSSTKWELFTISCFSQPTFLCKLLRKPPPPRLFLFKICLTKSMSCLFSSLFHSRGIYCSSPCLRHFTNTCRKKEKSQNTGREPRINYTNLQLHSQMIIFCTSVILMELRLSSHQFIPANPDILMWNDP